MGMFSWINSDNHMNILGGEPIHLVCPDNTVLTDNYYDNYGRINGRCAYFIMTMWNRKSLIENKDSFKPSIHGWAKQEFIDIFYDENVTDEELYARADELEDSIREIGIDLWFLKDLELRNKILKYPLKFVANPRNNKYDSLEESEDDPNQGWTRYSKEKGSYLGTCMVCGRDVWSDYNWGVSDDEPCCSYGCYEEYTTQDDFDGDEDE